MTTPSFFLGILISTFYGVVFHLWRGGNAGRLFLYLILAWLGFWTGHWLGNHFNWSFASIGPLRLGTATTGSCILLALGYWLSQVEVTRK